ncbi:hypothetical protein CRG98_013950 [Punica granatum]|nr:hypothetical protein CRG98_013950 [Punica granatum]
MARNTAPPASEAQIGRPGSAPKPAGRGKRATKPPAQKRPPQRGLGVAQLERLRQQEQWKRMGEMPQHLRSDEFQFQALLDQPPTAAPLAGPPVQYMYPRGYMHPGQLLGVGRGLIGQRIGDFPYGLDRSVGSSYMAETGGSAVVLEPLKELSSMPKQCNPDHCDICRKKRSIVNPRNIVVFDHGVGDHVNNSEQAMMKGRDFLTLNLGNSFGFGGNSLGGRQTTDQDVEVKGVGRKLGNNIAVGAAGAGSSLLMEYEFFPGKSNSGRSAFPQKPCFPTEELHHHQYHHHHHHHHQEAASASAGFAVMKRSGGGDSGERSKDPANSIDLSLKLSY